MHRPLPRRLLLVLTAPLGLLLLAAPEGNAQSRNMYGGRAGSISYTFDSIKGANRRQRAVKKEYFYQKRCNVVGLYGRKRRAFRAAVAHADRVLRNPAFDRVLSHQRRWVKTRDRTAQILAKLKRRRARVIATIFRRTPKFPCHSDMANGHTNAFARRGVKLLLIYEAYLMKQYRAGAKGARHLARTVIHETLHTLGYSHAGIKPWSRPYNNTVPAFVGCVVQHWPARGRMNRAQERNLATYCAMSSRNQRRNRRRYVPWYR